MNNSGPSQIYRTDTTRYAKYLSRREIRLFLSSSEFEFEKQLSGVGFWDNKELNIVCIPKKFSAENFAEFFREFEVVEASRTYGCNKIVCSEGTIAFFDDRILAGYSYNKSSSVVNLFTTDRFRLSFSGLAALICLCDRGFPIHSCAIATSERLCVFAGDGGIGKTKIAMSASRRAGFNVLNDDLNLLTDHCLTAYDRPAAIYDSHRELFKLDGGRRTYRRSLFMRTLLKVSSFFGVRPKIYFEYDLVPSKSVFGELIKVCDIRTLSTTLFSVESVAGGSFHEVQEFSDDDAVERVLNSSIREWSSISDLFWSTMIWRHGSLDSGYSAARTLLKNAFDRIVMIKIGRMSDLVTIEKIIDEYGG